MTEYFISFNVYSKAGRTDSRTGHSNVSFWSGDQIDATLEVVCAKGGSELVVDVLSEHTPTGSKPKAPGGRLPLPAGWRIDNLAHRSFEEMTWSG
jgi:hypothetical protein